MYQKFLLGAAILAGAFVLAGGAHAETMKGRCEVAASVHGGKRFAVLKCDKADRPGDFVIRSTVWESSDHAGYSKLARFSGHRFTCDLTRGGTSRSGWTESTHYQISRCH
jgi:hypothetical protein